MRAMQRQKKRPRGLDGMEAGLEARCGRGKRGTFGEERAASVQSVKQECGCRRCEDGQGMSKRLCPTGKTEVL